MQIKNKKHDKQALTFFGKRVRQVVRDILAELHVHRAHAR